MNIFKSRYLPSLVALGFVASAISCGKESSKGADNANPTPTPTPVATEAPETNAVSFWLAANPKDGGGPIAVRFDGGGRLSLTVDLFEAGLDYGPITAFHFLDASTLMFFVDAGTDKETLGTLDVKSALVKNKAWGAESSIKAAFKSLRAKSLVTGFQSGVLHAQIGTGIKSIRYNSDGGLSADEFFSSSSPAATGCPIDSVNHSALIQGGDTSAIALLSSGTVPRINILTVSSGAVTCKGTLNYGDGPETTAQHKAVNVMQNSDGKVYVLYQHETNPLLMRYDFDGTNLSNATKIYSGVNNMGKTPLGLIARTNKRLLIGRTDIGALIEIQLKPDGGEQTDFYKRTSFAKDLTALIAEPPQ